MKAKTVDWISETGAAATWDRAVFVTDNAVSTAARADFAIADGADFRANCVGARAAGSRLSRAVVAVADLASGVFSTSCFTFSGEGAAFADAGLRADAAAAFELEAGFADAAAANLSAGLLTDLAIAAEGDFDGAEAGGLDDVDAAALAPLAESLSSAFSVLAVGDFVGSAEDAGLLDGAVALAGPVALASFAGFGAAAPGLDAGPADLDTVSAGFASLAGFDGVALGAVGAEDLAASRVGSVFAEASFAGASFAGVSFASVSFTPEVGAGLSAALALVSSCLVSLGFAVEDPEDGDAAFESDGRGVASRVVDIGRSPH